MQESSKSERGGGDKNQMPGEDLDFPTSTKESCLSTRKQVCRWTERGGVRRERRAVLKERKEREREGSGGDSTLECGKRPYTIPKQGGFEKKELLLKGPKGETG